MFKIGLCCLLTVFIASSPATASHYVAQHQGKTMNITIGQSSLTAELANTPASQELAELLPLTLNMQDHLHNEKFATLPKSLSRNDVAVGKIEAGDVMLWNGDTLVVFYKSFHSSYRYTRLGKIKNVEQLKNAVGSGNIQMTFTQP